MYRLYLGDAVEDEVLSWLIENISGLVMTTKPEFHYYNTYHGDNDLWIMNTTDVSDVSSSKWDEITEIVFQTKEDAMLCSLRFGGRVV
jgi:aromatic ring-cleaving dioxygenase